MGKPKMPTTTVGHLRDQLAGYPDHHEIAFGGLEFMRIRWSTPTLALAEFRQSLSLDAEGRLEVEDNLDSA